MSQRKVIFAHNEYYHLYNRGNSKQDIFKDYFDRERFQNLLYVANGSAPYIIREVRKDDVYEFERGNQLVHIGAYCLMPNHFHVLLTPAVEHGIQVFMQKLTTGYSMYFNKKYHRTGGLFEGRFKSRHANTDEYLKYLFSYIHLNPVKLIQPDWKEFGIRDVHIAKKYLDTYPYSSLKDYFENREESKIISPEKFPEYFKNKQEIDSEMLEWLTYTEES